MHRSSSSSSSRRLRMRPPQVRSMAPKSMQAQVSVHLQSSACMSITGCQLLQRLLPIRMTGLWNRARRMHAVEMVSVQVQRTQQAPCRVRMRLLISFKLQGEAVEILSKEAMRTCMQPRLTWRMEATGKHWITLPTGTRCGTQLHLLVILPQRWMSLQGHPVVNLVQPRSEVLASPQWLMGCAPVASLLSLHSL
jgi:hypothetical protein